MVFASLETSVGVTKSLTINTQSANKRYLIATLHYDDVAKLK